MPIRKCTDIQVISGQSSDAVPQCPAKFLPPTAAPKMLPRIDALREKTGAMLDSLAGAEAGIRNLGKGVSVQPFSNSQVGSDRF